MVTSQTQAATSVTVAHGAPQLQRLGHLSNDAGRWDGPNVPSWGGTFGRCADSPVGQAASSEDDAWSDFMKFRSTLNVEPASEDWLANLDDAGIRDVVAQALEEKYA